MRNTRMGYWALAFILSVSLLASASRAELPLLIPREILFGNPEKVSPELSPDGKWVVAVDHVEPVLLVINPDRDEVAVRIPLEGNPRGAFKPRFTPDNSKLLVCNMNGTVNIITVADPHGKQTVLTVGKDPMGFAISPDGRTALVANHGDGTVSVISLAEGRVERLGR